MLPTHRFCGFGDQTQDSMYTRQAFLQSINYSFLKCMNAFQSQDIIEKICLIIKLCSHIFMKFNFLPFHGVFKLLYCCFRVHLQLTSL